MYKYSDCPANTAVFKWIAEQEGWGTMSPRFQPSIQIPEFSFDAEKLGEEVQWLTDNCPLTHWRSQAPKAVVGMSLFYDPSGDPSEKYCGSFGHPRYATYSPEDYFKVPMQEIDSAVKGDYLDELCFRKPIEEIDSLPELKRIIEWFGRPVVRATLRIIDGKNTYKTLNDLAGMHKDQPPEMAVRINLCIQATDAYGLQYEGLEPLKYKSGDHKVVNTDFNHRVYVEEPEDSYRIHIILDVLPWLDYDPVEDAWAPNEFWNKKHPYDMILDGDFKRS